MARKPTTQRWDKIGVELEGSWDLDTALVAKDVTGAKANHDGSVKDMGGICGEIATRPHALMDNIVEDIRKLYPKRVNTTCGLHAHLSFASHLDYSTLADKPFWEFYQERWNTWGKENQERMGKATSKYFWARLGGTWRAENPDGRGDRRNFCKAEFIPTIQLSDANAAHRYTQLNFSAWHKYKTIESRVLPMFEDVELTIDAIRETGAIFDDFLNTHKFPKIVIYKEWQAVGDVFVDETIVPAPDVSPIIGEKVLPFRAVQTGPEIEYSIEGAEGLMLPFVTEVRGNHP